MIDEIIFTVRESPEGGYEARALSVPIGTEADTLEDLRSVVRDAGESHFEAGERPKVIRLHFVRDEAENVLNGGGRLTELRQPLYGKHGKFQSLTSFNS